MTEISMWPLQWIAIEAIAKIAPKKVFWGFNGIRTHGLCVSAAVLSQLSYEDPYTGGWPIYTHSFHLYSRSSHHFIQCYDWRSRTPSLPYWTANPHISYKWDYPPPPLGWLLVYGTKMSLAIPAMFWRGPEPCCWGCCCCCCCCWSAVIDLGSPIFPITSLAGLMTDTSKTIRTFLQNNRT